MSQPQSSTHIYLHLYIRWLSVINSTYIYLESGVLLTRLQEREVNLLPGIPEDPKHFYCNTMVRFFDGDLIVHLLWH